MNIVDFFKNPEYVWVFYMNLKYPEMMYIAE